MNLEEFENELKSIRKSSSTLPKIINDDTESIEACLVDCDDVLVNTTVNTESCRNNASKAMTEAIIKFSEKYPEFKYFIGRAFEKGFDIFSVSQKIYSLIEEVASKEGSDFGYHYNVALERLGLPNNHKVNALNPFLQVVDAGVHAYHSKRDQLYKPSESVLNGLAYLLEEYEGRVGIVTKHSFPKKQEEKMSKLGILDIIPKENIRIVSKGFERENSKKDALQDLCRHLNVDPSNTVYIDDRLKALAEAGEVGIQTAYFFNVTGKYCVGPKRETAMVYGIPDYIITKIDQVKQLDELKKLELVNWKN